MKQYRRADAREIGTDPLNPWVPVIMHSPIYGCGNMQGDGYDVALREFAFATQDEAFKCAVRVMRSKHER